MSALKEKINIGGMIEYPSSIIDSRVIHAVVWDPAMTGYDFTKLTKQIVNWLRSTKIKSFKLKCFIRIDIYIM